MKLMRLARLYTHCRSQFLSLYLFQTNTFQAVLLTDGNRSYVYFLYDNLNWTSSSGCAVNVSLPSHEYLPQVTMDMSLPLFNCLVFSYMRHFAQCYSYLSATFCKILELIMNIFVRAKLH